MKSHGVMRPTYNEWRDYISALVRQLYADKEIETPAIHPNHMVEVINFCNTVPSCPILLKQKLNTSLTEKNMSTSQKTNVEIIYSMTNKAYHATEAIGSHTAINFGKSALHATAPPEDPTRAMEFGSACHKWILEEDDFYNEFAIPTLSLRSNAGKEMKRELEAKDLVIISEPDFDLIKEMKNALNREAKAYLDGKDKEVSIFCLSDDANTPGI